MPSKTYLKLIDDSPDLMTCAYGRSGRVALGMRGPADKVNLMYDLISNYDGPHILHRLSPDLSYISITPARLRAAIKLFIYVNVLHAKEAGSYDTWDEETGVYTLTQDVETAERLANEGAAAFMSSIPTKSFLPSDRSTPSYEYEWGARAA